MPHLLLIDTAVQSASVCLADGDRPLRLKANAAQKESAAWLHPAIQALLKESGLRPGDLAAVAVSAGPGSYTGLRVGLSAAKGLCYALGCPLITVNTLQMMAAAAQPAEGALLCPMIDARRLEVFTAVYDGLFNEVMPTRNLILNEQSFADLLEQQRVLFFGNGAEKFRPMVQHPNARFADVDATAAHLVPLAWRQFEQRQFASLAYAEPFYGKDFYSPVVKMR